MVTLRSRWKQNRTWNVRRYVTFVIVAGLCAVLVLVVKNVTVWLKDVVVPVVAPVKISPDETDSDAQYVGELVSQFEREFTVAGYTCVLPSEFELDVLPQPGDTPRGGRYTGVRFRASRDDVAQLLLIVIDYPKTTGEDEDQEGLD